MRLFIAVNFSEDTRARLIALRDELYDKSGRGRFSPPSLLHLTLIFLGECDSGQTDAVISAMDSLTFEPFEITIDRLGKFKRDCGDVWWAGVRKTEEVMQLQADLTEKLTAAAFAHDDDTHKNIFPAFEKHKYNPHITLGREIVCDAAPHDIEPFGETVTNISLMKSEKTDGMLSYTQIHKIEAR